ncbi:MAG: hypothetical protein AAGE80_08150 [Pseudomonadota bacterium]
MFNSLGPIVSTLLLIGVATGLGAYPIKKLIQVQEAKHELRHGSPGFFRTMSGWIIIAVWFAAIWFFATITGDWWATGDLEGAIARSGRRLELILRILAALSDD